MSTPIDPELNDPKRAITINIQRYIQSLLMLIQMMNPQRFSDRVWEELSD